ncbi:nitrilase-related carbon-nitrogen hydrolase [Acrocarpospora sp. B8E8]|uniref:nitrilase-related carbon-nitrogen hydrolase n=1 Tax=Acrocarpospora sp. B8E8 TaxID=3153572 RepID=UPI00325DC2EB
MDRSAQCRSSRITTTGAPVAAPASRRPAASNTRTRAVVSASAAAGESAASSGTIATSSAEVVAPSPARCSSSARSACVHGHHDQIPADFPHRDRVWHAEQEWVEPGNSIIIDPTGKILAGPARHEETILYADIDLAAVHAARRYFDPVGHYHRPDIFQLAVDTSPRPAVVTRQGMMSASEPADPKPPPA